MTDIVLGANEVPAGNTAGPSPMWPISIDHCTTLETNTLANPGWLPGDSGMVYRYPSMPTTGTWQGYYSDLMRIRSAADITSKRNLLRTRMWQSTSMLAGTYDRLTTNVANTDGTTNPSVHDEYELDMAYWVTTSRVWRYHPTVTRSGVLLIIHGGHANHGPEHVDLIPIRQDALAAGHDVIVCSMPGMSVNVPPGPTGTYLGVYNGPFVAHANLPGFDAHFLAATSAGSPFGVPPQSGFHVFIAPVHRMLNAILGAESYSLVAMTGLSGGASTTLKCAALDQRIQYAAAVAGGGCIPRYVSYQTATNLGDNEDQVCTWMGGANASNAGANDEETQILACDGGRTLDIFVGDQDPVYGAGINPAMTYGPAAAFYAKQLGRGTLNATQVVNNTHSWSSGVRAQILAQIARMK